jgi:hypothetical protein
MINFPLISTEIYSSAFRELGINDFHSACQYLMKLPYGRNANRHDFLLTLTEGKGTCSSKHAILAYLADENGQKDVELIVGIFLMSAETHPKLTTFFSGKPYVCIPEAHCYLRYKGERFDYTDSSDALSRIAPKIVREQRAEPQQLVDWKPMIHRHYLEGWLKRNPQVELSVEELWAEREKAIAALSR